MGLGSKDNEVMLVPRTRSHGGMVTDGGLPKSDTNGSASVWVTNRSLATTVPVSRIDSLFATAWKGERLALAHLDVEGVEAAALAGAARELA